MHRHGYKGRKFGREKDQRRALIKLLADSLVIRESIETTLPKAKELLPYVEKLITKAKKGDLHNRRQVISSLMTLEAAHKLVDDIAPKLQNRTSGHLRIERTTVRRGDNVQMATVTFVDDLKAAPAAKSEKRSTKSETNQKSETKKSETAAKSEKSKPRRRSSMADTKTAPKKTAAKAKTASKPTKVPKYSGKTYSAKPTDVQRTWCVYDASQATLGRLSTVVARTLTGKGKPMYTPHIDCGDYAIVINADKLQVTGDKHEDKTYFRHTGYPGGIKSATLREKVANDATRVIEHAIRGMLPVNKLRSDRMKRLKVYAGDAHEHDAQKPTTVDLKKGQK